MKYISAIILSLFLLTGLQALAQDQILIPENFYLHKGDKLTLHLISAAQFNKQDELGFDPAKSESFMNYAGSKKNAKAFTTKAGDTAASMQLEKEGLNLIG